MGIDRIKTPRLALSPPPPEVPEAQLHAFHARTRRKGVNPFVYWPVRLSFQPFFRLYFRMERIGRRHIPSSGGVILASNHRSFIDPFLIACLVRRPVYFMAKQEIFNRRWQAWLLNNLGAFPVRRAAHDGDSMETAREILARGGCLVIFPEGTRVRPGPLGEAHRGVGRLALQTGARVVPVAVYGTENIRRGWRIRPRKVRLRCGRPLQFPTAEHPSLRAAGMVTERVWACVNLQWEWLGGAPAPREDVAAVERDEPRVGEAV